MIKYTTKTGFLLKNTSTWFFASRTFRFPVVVGLIASTICVALGLAPERWPEFSIPSLNTTAYSSFTFLVGFLVIFRTSQSYLRFWEGATKVHALMGDWFCAVSTLFAYCRHSKAEYSKILEFQQTLIRLVSLLNAMALAELEGDDIPVPEPSALRFQLVDVTGLDETILRKLHTSKNRPEVVFQWVQLLIVEAINTGVMNIAPPLLTRVFQQLALGMTRYHEMLKFATVPMPFPYVVTAELLILMHLIVTPVFLTAWLPTPYAAILSFALSFVIWSLHLVASELENPFEGEVNDLNMHEIQLELNNWLAELSSELAQNPPSLSMTPTRALARLDSKKRSFSDLVTSAAPDRDTPTPTEVSASDVSRELSACSGGLLFDEHDRATYDLEAQRPKQHEHKHTHLQERGLPSRPEGVAARVTDVKTESDTTWRYNVEKPPSEEVDSMGDQPRMFPLGPGPLHNTAPCADLDTARRGEPHSVILDPKSI